MFLFITQWMCKSYSLHRFSHAGWQNCHIVQNEVTSTSHVWILFVLGLAAFFAIQHGGFAPRDRVIVGSLLCKYWFATVSFIITSRRAPLDSSYPLSLVDIVEGLEDKSRGQEGGLDTTDSGYSQDTNKEKSPLTTENVNSDDEEATVLEDIFFLSGRVWRLYMTLYVYFFSIMFLRPLWLFCVAIFLHLLLKSLVWGAIINCHFIFICKKKKK